MLSYAYNTNDVGFIDLTPQVWITWETRELEQFKSYLVQSFFTYALLDGLGFGAMIPLLLINTCQRKVSMRTLDIHKHCLVWSTYIDAVGRDLVDLFNSGLD